MTHPYLVVSDLHLCDIEEHSDGWKAYKGPSHVFDDEFAALLNSVNATAEGREGAPWTLILNGDIFDFDLVTAIPDEPPWPVGRGERRRGLHPTAEKSAWKLEHILDDHPGFVTALAQFLLQGHRVVYVLGNHDREFHFPAVQKVLVSALRRRAEELGGRLDEEPIRFEPWFYYVPGEIYAEHGQQYDYYSSFKNILSPTVETKDGCELALPMGNLSNRYLMSQMGFFNPHASDFILNVFRYFAHWLRYYAMRPRSIVGPWFLGSLLVVFKLLQVKKRVHARPAGYEACLERTARRAGVSLSTLQELSRLQRPPITTRFYRIARELWLDRVAIVVLMTGGTIALALLGVPLWVKLMVPLSTFPLLYVVYEWLAQGDTIFTIERDIPGYARKISELLGVRVVTFGHTHLARVIPLAQGTAFVDTGTWAPTNSHSGQSRVAAGRRNYLVARFEAGEAVEVKLDSWTEQKVRPTRPSLRLAS